MSGTMSAGTIRERATLVRGRHGRCAVSRIVCQAVLRATDGHRSGATRLPHGEELSETIPAVRREDPSGACVGRRRTGHEVCRRDRRS
jgi:hypothetical protein